MGLSVAEVREMDRRVIEAKRLIVPLGIAVDEGDSGLTVSEKRWVRDVEKQLWGRDWVSREQLEILKKLYRRVT